MHQLVIPLLSQQSLFPLVTEKLKGGAFDIKTWGSVQGTFVTGGFLRVGVGQNIGESTDQTEVF